MDLSVKAFSISGGVLMAIIKASVLFSALKLGYGITIANFMADLYYGVAISVQGIVFGAMWGFVLGFLFFGLFAWIYNRFI